jgi:hypothetical protein
LLAPAEEIRALEEKLVRGDIPSYEALLGDLRSLHERYADYAWQYVSVTFEKEFGYRLEAIPREQFLKILDEGQKASLLLQSSILEDSRKEFGPASRIGYGLDLSEAEAEKDFESVRGTIEGNAVVRSMTRASEEILARFEAVRKAVIAAG